MTSLFKKSYLKSQGYCNNCSEIGFNFEVTGISILDKENRELTTIDSNNLTSSLKSCIFTKVVGDYISIIFQPTNEICLTTQTIFKEDTIRTFTDTILLSFGALSRNRPIICDMFYNVNGIATYMQNRSSYNDIDYKSPIVIIDTNKKRIDRLDTTTIANFKRMYIKGFHDSRIKREFGIFDAKKALNEVENLEAGNKKPNKTEETFSERKQRIFNQFSKEIAEQDALLDLIEEGKLFKENKPTQLY